MVHNQNQTYIQQYFIHGRPPATSTQYEIYILIIIIKNTLFN